ncbi:MAG: phosphatase PAP2 family protein [Calditrichaceae bacterium]
MSINGLFVLIIISVSYLSDRYRYGWMLAHVLPVLLYTFIYTEAGHLIHLIHTGWFDSFFSLVDKAVFGVNLGLWVEQFDYPWLNEIFRIGYGSYYFLVIFGVLIHFISRNRQNSLRLITTITTAFCISYLLFILFPTQGPRFYHRNLYSTGMDGLFFSSLQKTIIAKGGFQGGAFPSSHIAVSLLVLFSLFKNHRKAFWIFTPFNLLLIIGTVWGRYHYAIDGVAGITLSIGVWYLYQWMEHKYLSGEEDSNIENALIDESKRYTGVYPLSYILDEDDEQEIEFTKLIPKEFLYAEKE